MTVPNTRFYGQHRLVKEARIASIRSLGSLFWVSAVCETDTHHLMVRHEQVNILEHIYATQQLQCREGVESYGTGSVCL